MTNGELAAVCGSISWATCAVFFTAAARRLGAFNLNLVRLWMAVGLLAATLLVLQGSVAPEGASGRDWLWLGLSAVVGLVIGDVFMFSAYKQLGPRITLLLFTLAPPAAAAGEWLIMGNPLGPVALAGMGITLAGVLVVVFERARGGAGGSGTGGGGTGGFQLTAGGVLCGAGGALCQGFGLVLSKMGLGTVDPLSGTFMRMIVAAPLFTLVFFALGGRIASFARNHSGLGYAFGGAFFGPFIGVTLSLAAAKYTHSGIAQTILSTTPITVLPYAVLVYRERLSARALLGTIVAVIGVAVLFDIPKHFQALTAGP